MHDYLWKLLVTIIVIVGAGAKQTALNHPVIPQTFGLATVTYARNGSISEFEGFITRFALMDCPIMTEINVVWNNEKTPKEMGVLKDKANWKRPVNFYLTPYNSLRWRYKIPKESKARVYFSLDDESITSCKSLTKAFRFWQANAVGDIGPVVSYASRSFVHNDQGSFTYRVRSKYFFTMGLMGYAFISRHFFELFESDLWEMSEMRKVVAERNNCEDIAINFIAEYFYPEMQTTTFRGQRKSTHPESAVSKSSGHVKKRNECIGLYSSILGVNPLRYKPKQESYPGNLRGFPFRNETVWARRTYLEREVIHKGALDNLQGDLGSLREVSPLNEQQEDGRGQGKQVKVGMLEKQLADALRREAKLSTEYRELKKKLQKDYNPMGGSVGTSLQSTGDSNQDDAPFSQWSYNAVIYGGVVLICLALLLCLCRQVQTGRQLAAIKTMKINMPKQQDFALETARRIQKHNIDSV